MKTKVEEIARTLDNAIEDVNAKYAKETAVKVSNDLYIATLMLSGSMICLGDAAIHATKLTVRSAKTAVKAAVIKTKEFYEEIPVTTVRR